jgi:hypothetical protein
MKQPPCELNATHLGSLFCLLYSLSANKVATFDIDAYPLSQCRRSALTSQATTSLRTKRLDYLWGEKRING